jgi:hypothetical protein
MYFSLKGEFAVLAQNIVNWQTFTVKNEPLAFMILQSQGCGFTDLPPHKKAQSEFIFFSLHWKRISKTLHEIIIFSENFSFTHSYRFM